MNRKGEAKEKHQCHHFLYFLDSKTCGPLSQGSAAVVVAELFAVHHKETHPWLYERARSFQYYVPYATHLCGCRLHIILIEINNVCFCIHLRKQKEKKNSYFVEGTFVFVSNTYCSNYALGIYYIL